MNELILTTLTFITFFVPIIISLIGGEDKVKKVQNLVLGYHLVSLVGALIILLGGSSENIFYFVPSFGNEFVSNIFTISITKVSINFLIILHTAGFIQTSLKEEFEINKREIFCYFLFYLIISLAISSLNLMTVVMLEELLFFMLYLNYKVKESQISYESKFFKFSNALLLFGALIYMADKENMVAGFLISLAFVIKLQLVPFNRTKFSISIHC